MPRDQDLFIAHIALNDGTRLLRTRSDSPGPKTLPFDQAGSSNGFLVRTEDVHEITWNCVANGYHIDTLRSQVIEWSPSRLIGNELRRGRLFFDAGYFDSDNSWRLKSEDFIRWARSRLNWIKKNFTFNKDEGAYIGTDAEIAAEQGAIRLRSF